VLDNENENKQKTRNQKKSLNHEIRSVMQGLLGYLAIFGDEIKPNLSVEEAQLFDRIEFFAQKLSDHVTELLDKIYTNNNQNYHS
jgi:hypothetical protein